MLFKSPHCYYERFELGHNQERAHTKCHTRDEARPKLGARQHVPPSSPTATRIYSLWDERATPSRGHRPGGILDAMTASLSFLCNCPCGTMFITPVLEWPSTSFHHESGCSSFHVNVARVSKNAAPRNVAEDQRLLRRYQLIHGLAAHRLRIAVCW